ncbi:MAG: sorbosone dehydrogenase family protein [Sphingomonadales bacterium]|nr:sorbosone dehydrogenase family protein [Sphingomonadales bacterium]
MATLLRKLLVALAVILVVLGGFTLWVLHGNPTDQPVTLFEGTQPQIVDPEPETIPTIGLVETIGWAAGEAPTPAPGLAVNRWAEGLNHPRTMITLPNGDVLVAETDAPALSAGGVTGFFERIAMRYVGAAGHSPDTVLLLRDSSGSGHADQRFVLRHDGLHSPSGMAWGNGTLYIANDDAVLAFAFTPGETSLAGSPRVLMPLPPDGNHWMRNLLLSPDGKKLYVAIGSASNIGERGMAAETGRAAIYEIDLASGHAREYAAGLRNPNGLAWNPASGELWTTVNERDQIGPNLVPDYLTNVPVGAHYGWPWVYWKNILDERVDAPMPDYLTDYTRKPEYALGPHVAALGMVFADGGERLGPQFADGAFIARHGSWNRKPPSGYDVVFVAFDDHGNPHGLPVPVLTGFLAGDGKTHGRPTWVTWAKDGALLVSDDTAGIIWRVIAPGAAPSPPIKPVEVAHMQAPRDLVPPDQQDFTAKFQHDEKVKEQGGVAPPLPN